MQAGLRQVVASDCLPTDVVLLRLQGPQPHLAALTQRLVNLPACRDLGAAITRAAWSADARVAYLYLALPSRMALLHRDVAPLAGAADSAVRSHAARLTLMHDISGHSSGEDAPFHYVVEMTPEEGFGIELQRWYDTEHLPGLASVPGCARAQRYWNHDQGPRSLACYDLMTQETQGSPDWLAVRNTSWSDRMRPRFTQTVRTMFTTLR